MRICDGFTAHLIDGFPVFVPTPYRRLPIFTYTAAGQLHKANDPPSPHGGVQNSTQEGTPGHEPPEHP